MLFDVRKQNETRCLFTDHREPLRANECKHLQVLSVFEKVIKQKNSELNKMRVSLQMRKTQRNCDSTNTMNNKHFQRLQSLMNTTMSFQRKKERTKG